MTIDATSVSLHLSCHCRAFTSTLSIPSTSLPLKSAICHCSLCRHATGQIFATFAVVPLADTPSITHLTAFSSSEHLTRWFCSTCGCSVWNDDRLNNEWELATGVISGVSYGPATAEISSGNTSRGQGSPEGLAPGMKGIDSLLDRVHLFIGSTGDGGSAIWFNETTYPSTPPHRHIEARNSSAIDTTAISEMSRKARRTRPSESAPSTLTLICACHKIHLTVSRASPSTTFPAGLDACFSCRKTAGFEITSWATIPRANFRWATDGSPVTLEEDVFGVYSTTEKVQRYFCRGCGVPAVYGKDDGRETWDVAMGLLVADGEGDEGATRLEAWLRWNKYGERGVEYVEDAVDGEFVRGLREGVWSDEKGKEVL